MIVWLQTQLESLPLEGTLSDIVVIAGSYSALILVLALSFVLSRVMIRGALSKVVAKTKTKTDDILLSPRVLARISTLIPAVILMVLANEADLESTVLSALPLALIAQLWIILGVVLLAQGIVEALYGLYQNSIWAKRWHIKSYVQVVQLIIAAIGTILGISALSGESPGAILAGIGAVMAVLLLIFKDTLLGLVASVQLSANQLVRIGDWIEMPKNGADGTVVDITLQTIKVQNFDKTIVSLPAYSLVAESFKNWRGMSEAGGRRIKRSLSIDCSTIGFCSAETEARIAHLPHGGEALAMARQSLHDSPQGAQLSNIAVFRAYSSLFLKDHKKINKDLTFLVRELQPGPTGLPVEFYVFCSDTRWTEYERIQADLVDHLICALDSFGLRLFQYNGYPAHEGST